MAKAIVKQVIIVTSTIGNGKDDPFRPYVQVFELDGTEIPVGDYCKEPA